MVTMTHTKKPIQALPFFVYFCTITVLALAGLIDSIYMAISHYRVYTDIGYKSFCAISRSINCDTVSQSHYSIFLNVPVPVWGIIGYTFFLLFIPFAWSRRAEKEPIWSLLILVSLFFSLYSISLALISTFLVHSFCIMCIVSYGINFMLLFYTYLIRKRFATSSFATNLKRDLTFLWEKRKQGFAVFGPFIIGVVLVQVFFPVYWSFEPPELSARIPHGITEDGHPWIGAENPVLEIIEFTDYQCFQCNKMHFFLRQTMVNYPGKIRLIHRHFPMDHEFNPLVKTPIHHGSGKMAMLTIYAATQNKFWQMSDTLFSIARVTPRIRFKELAQEVGLEETALTKALYDPKIQHKLKKDIRDGIKLGVTGTPTFVINGNLYRGQIPAEIIKKILD
jgi:uncharacterized membrane protein/predicted DsbA family dithiol-disulfide isomerase